MTVSNTYTVTNLPAKTDFRIYAGDTFLQTVQIREDGALVSLTGSTFSMRIKDNRGTTLLTLTTGSGITTTGTGEILVTLTAAQTDALTLNCALPYDLQWTTAASVKKTLLAGSIYVTNDITP